MHFGVLEAGVIATEPLTGRRRRDREQRGPGSV